MADNSVFQELIDVSLDANSFAKSLDEIISIYDSKLGELNKRGLSPDALSATNALSSITSELSEFDNALKVFSDNFLNTYNSILGNVESMATTSTQRAEHAIASTDTKWRKMVSDQLEQLADFANKSQQAYHDFEGAVLNAIDAQVNFKTLTRETQLEVFKVIEGAGTLFDELKPKQQEWFTDFQQGMARIAESAKVTVEEIDAAWSKAILQNQAYDMKRVQMYEQAQKEMRAAGKLTAEQMGALQDQALRKDEEYQRKRIALIEQAAKMDAARSKPQGFSENLISGLTGGADITKGLTGFFTSEFPEMLGQVLRFQVLWGLVGAAIKGVEAALMAVVNWFKTGWEYLSQLEQKAADLHGVLAATVQFSANMAENFRLTGQAAEVVAKRLEDVAINAGLSEKSLQSAFKALMESGGANFGKTLNDMVRLTEMFGLAMKAAGKDAQATRSLISEIPKLLDNSIDKHSKILEVLHLTKDQWSEIRKQGLEHHDLVQRLEPALRPYLTVAQQAELRHEALNEQIELMTKRSEALVAEPMWKAWHSALEKAKGFFMEHQAQINAILSTIGHLIESAWNVAAAIVSWAVKSDYVRVIFNAIAVLLQAIVESASLLLNTLTLGLKIAGDLINTLTNPSNWLRMKDAMKDLWESAKAHAKDYSDKALESVNRINDAMTGEKTSAANKNEGEGLLSELFKPTTGVPDNSAPGKDQTGRLSTQYSRDIAQIRQFTTDAIKNIDAAEKAGTISAEEASKRRVKAHDDELSQVKALVVEYDKLLKSSNGKQERKDDLRSRLGEDYNNEVSKDNSATNTEAAKVAENRKAIEKTLNETLIAGAKQHAAAMNEIYKQETQAGLHTKLEAFDHEVSESKKEHEVLIAGYMQELLAADNNGQKIAVVVGKIALANQRYTDKVKQNTLTRIALSDEEAAKQRNHENTMAMLNVKAMESEAQRQQKHGATSKQIRQTNADIAAAYLNVIASERAAAEAELAEAEARGASIDVINQKREALEKLNNAEIDAANAKQQADDQNNNGTQVVQKIFGDNVTSLKDAFKDFDTSVNSIKNAFDTFKGAASNIINGFKQGGAAGGIGAIMSTVGGFLPGPAGQILQIGGAVLGMISGLFTRAAKRIAEEIKKSVESTIKSYQNGTSTLQDTIAKLEAERQDAIRRLSGKKGGQDQLNNLLPQIDDELTQLKKQQKDIFDNFEKTLEQARLWTQNHADVLANALKTWQDINKQVTDYLNAGGDAAKAAEMLSINLAKLKEDAATNLSEGEQTAINDMTQLNDLLQQRVQLVEDFKKQEFDLINGDSIEKRGSKAIENATALNKARDEYNAKLSDVDSQINLATKKVDLEKQVYDIASDTAALKARSAQLELDTLQKELEKLKEYKALYQSIYQKPDGSNGLQQTVFAGAQVGTIQVNINTGGAPVNGAQLVGEINDELKRRGRYGLGTDVKTYL
jgi:hypothetical protein